MDQLALLCTLHADGPRTLRLLREIGCNSMADLESFPSEDLAGVLHLPPAAARRLSREASRLGLRLDSELEAEEITYPPASNRLAGCADTLDPRATEPLKDASTDPVQRLNLRDRDLLERVVSGRNSAPPIAGAAPVCEPSPEPLGASSKVSEPDQLRAGDVEGLDEATCDSLIAAGIKSLADLVACSVDELVVRIGMPFIQARSLQFRAGKRVGGVRSVVTPERLSPSDSPRPEPQAMPGIEPDLDLETERSFIIPRPVVFEEGSAAGPFA